MPIDEDVQMRGEDEKEEEKDSIEEEKNQLVQVDTSR